MAGVGGTDLIRHERSLNSEGLLHFFQAERLSLQTSPCSPAFLLGPAPPAPPPRGLSLSAANRYALMIHDDLVGRLSSSRLIHCDLSIDDVDRMD